MGLALDATSGLVRACCRIRRRGCKSLTPSEGEVYSPEDIEEE